MKIIKTQKVQVTQMAQFDQCLLQVGEHNLVVDQRNPGEAHIRNLLDAPVVSLWAAANGRLMVRVSDAAVPEPQPTLRDGMSIRALEDVVFHNVANDDEFAFNFG